MAQLLLQFDCWGFQRPSSKRAPLGQDISSPAAYFFGTVSGRSAAMRRQRLRVSV